MAKKEPLRQCVGCNTMQPKHELMRVVMSPEGDIHLDFSSRANGRGAYVCKNNECLENAIKRKGLERSFKTAVPAELYEKLKEEFSGNQ